MELQTYKAPIDRDLEDGRRDISRDYFEWNSGDED